MPVEKYFTVISESDGLPLSVLCVLPDLARPKGLVQFSHGMCEYKRRYLTLMRHLADHGYACIINDHRGHGDSVRKEEDLGYFYQAGAKGLVEDLHQITLYFKKRYSGLKLFLFGHSMGSLAARCYRQKYDGDIDGLIVCGSPGLNRFVGVGFIIVNVLTLLCGERYHSRLLERLTTGSFNRRFEREGHPFAWLSTNEESLIDYEGDPRCGFEFTLNGYRALFTLLRDAYDTSVKAGNPDMPVMFISGADDPCMPKRKYFEEAVSRIKAAGYKNVNAKLYPGCRHEVFSEAESVRQDIALLLDQWTK